MDRSLWLLLRLRTSAWFRSRSRSLCTLKGALLALAGSLIFLPSFVLLFIVPRVQIEGQATLVRRYGALALFAYCILNVLLSAGERALSYTPAEVCFLFSGPYRARHLLLYKVVGSLGATAVATLFLSFVLQHHSPSYLAAAVGLFLSMNFLSLFTILAGLLAGTLGALAFNRRRKLLLPAFGVLAAVALAQSGRDVLALPASRAVDRVANAPVMRVVLAPFQPFARVFASEQLWPDLAGWSLLALSIDLALLGIALALNARFLEVTATASARIYDRLQQARKTGGWTGKADTRLAVPMLPWWGGVGPNLWRQLTSAARNWNRVAAIVGLFSFPVLVFFLIAKSDREGEAEHAAYPALAVLASLMIFAPTMVGHDFRPDLARIGELKTLPIAPGRLVIGQLVAPILILTLAQGVALALIGIMARFEPLLLAVILVFTLPVNLLLVALENLAFLWFPIPWTAGAAAGFEGMGRQFVFLMAKMMSAGLVVGTAVAVGAAAYFVSGQSWAAALVAAWLAAAGGGLAFIPLVAQAFMGFDVASDRLE